MNRNDNALNSMASIPSLLQQQQHGSSNQLITIRGHDCDLNLEFQIPTDDDPPFAAMMKADFLAAKFFQNNNGNFKIPSLSPSALILAVIPFHLYKFYFENLILILNITFRPPDKGRKWMLFWFSPNRPTAAT